MHAQKLRIADILIEDRQRKDLGDIDELAKSISEVGLIQPVVVNQNHRLVAGCRRVTACKLLQWTEIPIVYVETLTERQLTMMELEENIRRKEMDWKERATCIAKIHTLRVADTLMDPNERDSWTTERTGQLMGMSQASVCFAILVAKELKDEKSEIHECDGFTDALRWVMRKREDEANAELARQTQEAMRFNRDALTALTPLSTHEGGPEVEPIPDSVAGTHVIPLSKQLILGDCRGVLSRLPEGCVDHCITDPPYAIDMDMLNQQNPHGGMKNIDRVAETHQVDSNLALLDEVIPQIYRVVKERGFFIFWCDVMNWQFLYDKCISVGFKVQRWSLIWQKTSQCMNQCAQYNFTKNYEIAMVCRKQSATLVSDQQTSIFSCPREEYLSNPFAKPFLLWDWIVKAVSIPGQTILDPFAGEGSSVQSIVSLWRFPLAIEIEEKHYNYMLERTKAKYDIMYRKPTYV